MPTDYLQELSKYWGTAYDWRASEAELNKYPQFTTVIQGQTVHFLHVRSSEANATPLMLWKCLSWLVADVKAFFGQLSRSIDTKS